MPRELFLPALSCICFKLVDLCQARPSSKSVWFYFICEFFFWVYGKWIQGNVRSNIELCSCNVQYFSHFFRWCNGKKDNSLKNIFILWLYRKIKVILCLIIFPSPQYFWQIFMRYEFSTSENLFFVTFIFSLP